MELSKTYWVYILASRTCTLYIGFTNDFERRVSEHKQGEIEGFTHDYGMNRLVYYEGFGDPTAAIGREKQLKGWKRYKKVELIESVNPKWLDLSDGWYS